MIDHLKVVKERSRSKAQGVLFALETQLSQQKNVDDKATTDRRVLQIK